MARNYKAPGVYREELDLSEILVPTGISNGGIVIRSIKGPINRPVLVTNDQDFISTFGSPYFVSGCGTTELAAEITATTTPKLIPEYGYGSYAALEFLKESQTLYVVRGFNAGSDKFANATVATDLDVAIYSAAQFSATAISAITANTPDSLDKIQSIDSVSVTGALNVAALYPGQDGNTVAVTIEASWSGCDWANNYDEYVSSAAITAHPIAAKVFKLNVFKMDNNVTSWSNYYDNTVSAGGVSALRILPVETFYGTLVPQIDSNKNQLFIENVVNGISKYIYVKAGSVAQFKSLTGTGTNKPINSDAVGPYVDGNKLITLANGFYTQNTGIGSDTTSWQLFADRELVNIGILIGSDWTNVTKQALANIVASRLDCIAVAQAGTMEDNTYIETFNQEKYGYAEPSYVALYAGWSKVYDNYNSKFIYLPNSIYGASLMARTDNVSNPWNAPAGIDRGTLSVFDQMKVFNLTDIGNLYDKNINTVRFIRGTGYVMWGQKTAQMKKSALDRINVRRLLLYIENNIETALLPFVFENNNDKTRLRVFSLVDEFMSGVKSGGGVTAYNAVCDTTNNTPTVIDSNQLALDLYVQPTRTAEFIAFRTIVTRTGVSFSAVR